LSRARFIGGAEARVHDVSASGLLVLTTQRTRIGLPVYLQFPGVEWLPRQRGTVARCYVSCLSGDPGVEYGVAVHLSTPLSQLWELVTQERRPATQAAEAAASEPSGAKSR
jgi:hypothetical protein